MTTAIQQPHGQGKEIRTRQHWHVVAMPIFYTALFFALLLWIWIKTSDNFLGRALFAFVAMVFLAPWYLVALKPFALWFGTTYRITNERVIVETGVLRSQEKVAFLTEVGKPDIDRPFVDMLFGSGKLKITSDMTLEHVPRVKEVQERVIELVARLKIQGVSAGEAAKQAQDAAHQVHAMMQSNPAPAAEAPPPPPEGSGHTG